MRFNRIILWKWFPLVGILAVLAAVQAPCVLFAQSAAGPQRKLPADLADFFMPPQEYRSDLGGHDLVELHALMAPRPVLVSGGTADLPERWTALNHAIAVNRLLGYEHRVGMTNRNGHSPTQQANEQVYRFFEWSLNDPQ